MSYNLLRVLEGHCPFCDTVLEECTTMGCERVRCPAFEYETHDVDGHHPTHFWTYNNAVHACCTCGVRERRGEENILIPQRGAITSSQ